MYTSTVGKTFLKEYNRRNNQNYSAREFFDKVLFKLFFDDKKYMFWAKDSPFVQGVSTHSNGELGLRKLLKKSNGDTECFSQRSLEERKLLLVENDQILSFKTKKRKSKNEYSIETLNALSKDLRQNMLQKFHHKVQSKYRDASVAFGFPASDEKEYAVTSGQVCDLHVEFEDEEVYFSWIGGMLSLGVDGGYALLFDDPIITYLTFEGWKVYRQYLNDVTLSKLQSLQIISWNGQWLTLSLDKRFPTDFDFSYFKRKNAFTSNEQKVKVKTVAWSNLFFSLSHQFPQTSQLAYVFALGKTNKTLGFIPFQLKSGRKVTEVYQQLFGEESYQMNRADFENLFGRHIKQACELGNIGLQALEPKNLRKYFSDSANLKLTRPNLKQKNGENDEDYENRKQSKLIKDQQNVITFQTYKTWLVAMLSKNKHEFLDYTEDIAKALVKYREGARKRDRATLIENKLFGKRGKQDFLENLIQIIQDDKVDNSIVTQIKELRDRVYLMNKEDFGYLWLLLKFDYAYQERISKY